MTPHLEITEENMAEMEAFATTNDEPTIFRKIE